MSTPATVRKIGIACLLAVFATGCARKNSLMAPAVPPLIKHAVYSDKSNYTPPADYTADKKSYADAVASGKEPAAEQYRNQIAYGLRKIIDGQYGEFRARLLSGQGAIGVAGDAASLGLTAAATIAHLAATKGIYAALATAVTGLNLSIDKNYFQQQSYTAIAAAMDAARGEIWQQISSGLTKNITAYPLNAVEADLVQYLYAGSLPGGFAEIQKKVGAASNTQPPAAGGTGASAFKVSPPSLAFAATKVGVTSASQTITAQNSGSSTTNISVSIIGTNSGDFAADSTACGNALAAGGSCPINVTFTPTATGAREASVTVGTGSGGDIPQTIAVTGTGTP